MSFSVIIPARLSSTRLPNKPLADIKGIPMVVRVAQQAAKSQANRVIVAADDVLIEEACKKHGIECCLTSKECSCGTDRLSEAVVKCGISEQEVVVNVQGDEPLIPEVLINSVAQILYDKPECSIGTAATPITSAEDFFNPNVVKVVLDSSKNALLFSRAPIPWDRERFKENTDRIPAEIALRHIGIYSYRASFLMQYPTLSKPPLEETEKLEQLRALWHGYKIGVEIYKHKIPPGVDTLDDLERVRTYFS